jgi:predicted transcriptional regulator of viral defense system
MKKTLEAIWRELLPRAPVFTTAKVAELTVVSLSSASRDLSKLAQEGLVTRLKRGLWAMTGHPDFSPYSVVPHLFTGGEEGYVSLLSAMSLHGIIEQIPRTVQVVARKARPPLRTPIGTYEFHRLDEKVFGGHGPYDSIWSFQIASREKALFDTFYLSVRKGKRFSALPELELPRDFSFTAVQEWLDKIEYRPLRVAVSKRLSTLDARDSFAEQVERKPGSPNAW